MSRYMVIKYDEITRQGWIDNWLRLRCLESAEINAKGFNTSTMTYDNYCKNPSTVQWVCFKNGDPVGFMFASIGVSRLDGVTIILAQDALYAPLGFKTVKLLYDAFIDFGHRHSDHIITMIGANTNIKPRSLERLGFNKLETLYRMEV